jgi:hypothetical protein
MRHKRMDVSPDVIVHLGSGAFRVIANELPPDVSIVRAGYDQERDVFSIVLFHQSWDDLQVGDKIPQVQAPVIERL